MTAALEGGEWSAARPGRTLPLGKTGYPFYTRLGGPQARSGRAENLVPSGIRFRTVQAVFSRYTPDGIRTPNPSKRATANGETHYTTKFISNLKFEPHKNFDIPGIYRWIFTDKSAQSSTPALKGTLEARYKRRGYNTQ